MAEHAHADENGSHEAHGHDDHGHGPHHDASFYYKTYGVLLGLLVVSLVGPEVGEALSLPIVTLITAFGIALVKAWIVIKNFMHLNVEKAFVHYFLITSLAFMGLFFFAVAPDVMKHEGTRWKNVAAEAWIEKVEAEFAAGGGEHHGAAADENGHGAGGAEHAPEGEHH